MSPGASWPWLGLLLLGVWHGVNPGMGWLFAVALGLQEGRGSAVWRALAPLALGHAAAVAVAILVAAVVGLVVPLEVLKWVVGGTLLVFGVSKLLRSRHPRYGGMRVGFRQLAVWSFLMASAHGAGLMVLPFVLGATSGPEPAPSYAVELRGDLPREEHGAHAAHGAPGTGGTGEAGPYMDTEAARSGEHGHAAHAAAVVAGLPGHHGAGLLATALHTAGYLLVTGLLALVFYRKLGLGILRKAWVNVDLVWAGALIVTALLTPLL